MEVIDGVVGLIAAVHVDLGQGAGIRPDIVSAAACRFLLAEQVAVGAVGEFGGACCQGFPRRRPSSIISDPIDLVRSGPIPFAIYFNGFPQSIFPRLGADNHPDIHYQHLCMPLWPRLVYQLDSNHFDYATWKQAHLHRTN
jgi:hypothetical protein